MDGDLLRDGKRPMLRRIHGLLNEADVVVTWNGDDFDLKILNKEFLLQRLPPPAPYKSLDIIKTSRGKFRFTSNKLAYVAEQLKVTRKRENRGHELWLDCMARKPKAFAEMRRYNRGDLPPLIGIFERFRPWISGFPNVNLYDPKKVHDPERPHCPYCGGARVIKSKNRVSKTRYYRQWQCQAPKCGGYFSDTKPQSSGGRRDAVGSAPDSGNRPRRNRPKPDSAHRKVRLPSRIDRAGRVVSRDMDSRSVGDVRGKLHLRRDVVHRPAAALAGGLEPAVIVALWKAGYCFNAYGKPWWWANITKTAP